VTELATRRIALSRGRLGRRLRRCGQTAHLSFSACSRRPRSIR